MDKVVSTFLSAPRIIEPFCTLRSSCRPDIQTAKVSFSMTVTGTLSYVLVKTLPPFMGNLTVADVYREALTPSALRPFMVNGTTSPVPSHHALLDIPEPAVTVQVPIAIQPNTTYQLLVAAQYSDRTTPCCFNNTLDTVQVYPISDSACRATNCCNPGQAVLFELQPEFGVRNSTAFPVGPPIGKAHKEANKFIFEQTFATIGAADVASDVITVSAGGQSLYDSQGPDQQPASVMISPAKRKPVEVKMVVQQETLYGEETLASGADGQGRLLHVRCERRLTLICSSAHCLCKALFLAPVYALQPREQQYTIVLQMLCGKWASKFRSS
jgi:hypothetical protein